MHVHRREIVLTGKNKGQIAIFYERDTLTVCCVNSIDLIDPTRLLTHLIRKVGHVYRTHIDRAFAFEFTEIKLCIHTIRPGSALIDRDLPHDCLWRGALEIDVQKSVHQFRSTYLNAVSQQKGPLKLPRRDTTMQKNAIRLIVTLPSTHDQLPILDCQRQVVLGKTGHSQSDPKRVIGNLFNVIRGIAVIGLGGAFHHAFQLVKSQKEWMGSQAQFAHGVLTQATRVPGPRKLPGHQIYGMTRAGSQVAVGTTPGPRNKLFSFKSLK